MEESLVHAIFSLLTNTWEELRSSKGTIVSGRMTGPVRADVFSSFSGNIVIPDTIMHFYSCKHATL
jgi:hypothetical protein